MFGSCQDTFVKLAFACKASGSIDINSDSGQLQFGADNDMQIFHNGASGKINNAVGSFNLDVAGDISFDAGGGDILLKDDGTQFGQIRRNGTALEIRTSQENGDMRFMTNDSGTAELKMVIKGDGDIGIGTSKV